MLAGAIHDPATVGRRVYGVMIAIVAVAGAAVAGRHVWLQSLPPGEAPGCARAWSTCSAPFRSPM